MFDNANQIPLDARCCLISGYFCFSIMFSNLMKKLAFAPDNLYTNIKEIIEVLEDLESVEEENSEIRLINAYYIIGVGFMFILFYCRKLRKKIEKIGPLTGRGMFRLDDHFTKLIKKTISIFTGSSEAL